MAGQVRATSCQVTRRWTGSAFPPSPKSKHLEWPLPPHPPGLGAVLPALRPEGQRAAKDVSAKALTGRKASGGPPAAT